MNRGEVVGIIISDICLIVRFCETVNIDKGEDLYNVCDLCGYRTKHVISDDMSVIDEEIARHLYNRHRSVVLKKIYDYQAEKTANAPGQQRLEVQP